MVSRSLFHRFSIGGMVVHQLYDGAVEHGPAHSFFGVNVNEATFSEFARSHCLSLGSFRMPATPTLVDADGQRILIDTGHGAERASSAGLVLSAMKEAQIDPLSVDHVVLTHLHADHIGGVLDGSGKAIFAKARHWVSPLELSYWSGPAGRTDGGADVATLVSGLGQSLSAITPGDELVRGFELVDTAGHTPGHLSVRLKSQGEELFVAGDLAMHTHWSIMKPIWHMAYDVNASKAVSTRLRVLNALADQGTLMAGYHMPFPAVGRISRKGDGFVYKPEELD